MSPKGECCSVWGMQLDHLLDVTPYSNSLPHPLSPPPIPLRKFKDLVAKQHPTSPNTSRGTLLSMPMNFLASRVYRQGGGGGGGGGLKPPPDFKFMLLCVQAVIAKGRPKFYCHRKASEEKTAFRLKAVLHIQK